MTLCGCAGLQRGTATTIASPQVRQIGLQDLDGQAFDLNAYAQGHDATVLVWWATKCPCVARYQARVADLQARYADRGLGLLLIASNADEDAALLLKTAKDRGIELPIIRDPSGAFAEALGALSTPTTVLLDKTGEVRFRGWMDNERLPGVSGREPYLENALTELLAGQAPSQTRAPVYGCRITRTLGETPKPCASTP